MSDLLNCPHCGSRAEFWVRNESNDFPGHKELLIGCEMCPAYMERLLKSDASVEDFEKEKQKLIEDWNHRFANVHDSERTAKVDGAGFGLIGHCHDCGTPIMSGKWKYCSECGCKLDWSE